MAVSANREESAARPIIEKAGASLARSRADIPASFIEQLYGRAVPEDVARYGEAYWRDFYDNCPNIGLERFADQCLASW